jgi:predicted acylesterase/phospholipase RssA
MTGSESSRPLTEVNLALGGGGAKGFVHLGVLEEVVERGIRVAAIVGTSVGAIIGALFAHFSTTTYQDQLSAAKAVSDLLVKIDFWKLADFNLLGMFRGALLGGERIDDWLRKILVEPGSVPPESVRFRDVDFDLTITATNAHTGDSLILNKHEEPGMFVHSAVRASMSIQCVFNEIELEVKGKPVLCWDGGTTGNCRFDLANRMRPERPTIASTLTYRGDVVSTRTGSLGFWLRPFKVLNHSTAILMRSIEKTVWESLPDDVKRNIILVEPRLTGAGPRAINTYDFDLSTEHRRVLINNGREATRDALDRFASAQQPNA